MRIIYGLVLSLFLAISFTACVTTPAKEMGRVHCPACGHELDALYQKRF